MMVLVLGACSSSHSSNSAVLRTSNKRLIFHECASYRTLCQYLTVRGWIYIQFIVPSCTTMTLWTYTWRMKTKFIILLFSFSLLISTLPAFAGSLACDYNPANFFTYSGSIAESIRNSVKKLTADCDTIVDRVALEKWQRSFIEKCSSLCTERLGTSSLDGGKCRQACGTASIESAEISHAYSRGFDDGKSACHQKASTDAPSNTAE